MNRLPYPCTIDGRKLRGWRLSKYLYLDESGIGDIRREPTVVVAGILLDTDTQWRRAADRLQQIGERHLGKPRGKAFHAKELFNGGKEFKRHTIQEVGWPILKDIVCIPRDLKLTVIWAASDRATRLNAGKSIEDATAAAYALAFSNCLLRAELWMKSQADSGEVATVVIEDNARMKTHLRKAFKRLASEKFGKFMADRKPQLTSLRHLIDTVHSVEKDDAPLLQIADACAYVIRRRLAGEWASDRFFDCLQVEMYPRPKTSALPPVRERPS